MASIDPFTDPTEEVYKHGMSLDTSNRRVQCCFCGKVVPGYNRLQQHLGAIQGNVTECPDVPKHVKLFFEEHVVSVKVGRFVNEIGDLCPPGPVSKRTCTHDDKANRTTPEKVASSQNEQIWDRKRGLGKSTDGCSSEKLTSNSNGSLGSQCSPFGNSTSDVKAKQMSSEKVSTTYRERARGSKPSLGNSMGRNSMKRSTTSSNGILASQGPSTMAKRRIGRFLFENAIDFSAVTSHSFKHMMEIFLNSSDVKHSIPSIAELEGWILDAELSEIENYVNKVQLSWPHTGCSILLDGWDDHLGRNLVNVIVDCPEGPMYLRSADVSPSTNGADALQLLLEAVLEEVGIQNVVQIIAHTWSDSLEALSKLLIEKYRSLFWSFSAGHSISLMLDKTAETKSIKLTLDRAKTITKFIYSRDALLNLLRRHISCYDLVKTSQIKTAASFLTLENLLLERSNLELMFTSSEWLESCWASSAEGKMVARLIRDSSFWEAVGVALKASIPLVKAVSLINGDSQPNMGFIYETMDQVKETISDQFQEKKSQYTTYWNIIDEIWNKILHSPLHAAGYFLNPRFHYTDDYFNDTEVTGGLLITIVRMVEDKHAQDLITQQLKVYGDSEGDFEAGIANQSHESLSPATWWSRFGGHCPELQRMAFKVLSQTCKGAEFYGLRRDVAEKLLSSGNNFQQCQLLPDLSYVHYNLHLKQLKMGAEFDIVSNGAAPMDDWIVDELYQSEVAKPENNEPTKSTIGEAKKCKGVELKTEPKSETKA